jgi:hypothetical protein
MTRLSLVGAASLLLVCACSKGQVTPTDPDDGGDGTKVCTMIGCVDGLRIDLQAGGGWAPGQYTFEFALDGAPVRCSGALPLRACEDGPSLTCDVPDRVQIGESGCALPPEQHGFGDIYIPSGPAQVELSITRDDQPLLSRVTLSPTYTETQPNGPGCEPICRGAAAQITLQ